MISSVASTTFSDTSSDPRRPMETVIKVNPNHLRIEALAKSLASNGVPPEAELIYRGRNRIYRMMYDGMEVNIKAFKVPSGIKSLIYGSMRSKASRSYENAVQLLKLGFLTPEPLAYVEIHSGPRLRESYYICRQIEAKDVRCWENMPDNEPLVRAVAMELARLHKAGIWHKDFSPGNVLYTGDAASGYTIYLIDVNRMRFGVTSSRTLMDNFRAINIVPEETERLARHYAGYMGLDPDRTARRALGVLHRFLRKKDILHALKRIVKPKKKK